MSFTDTFPVGVPIDPEQVGQGAQRIRTLALAVSERLASAFVDINVDPMVLKAGAVPSGYALTNPAINGGSHNNASFLNPTFSGVITGINLYPSIQRAELTSNVPLNAPGYADVVNVTLSAGTWLLMGIGQIGATSNLFLTGSLIISDNLNNVIRQAAFNLMGSSGSPSWDTTAVVSAIVTPVGSTIYKLRAQSVTSPSTMFVRGSTSGQYDTSLTAWKLA